MPIRPSQAARYPADWPQISRSIRVGRAGERCECAGQGGRGHPARCTAVNRQPHPVTAGMTPLFALAPGPTPADPVRLAAALTAEGWEQLGSGGARAVADLLTSAADEIDRRNTSSSAADHFDL